MTLFSLKSESKNVRFLGKLDDSFDVINGRRHNTIISKIINRFYIPYIYI